MIFYEKTHDFRDFDLVSLKLILFTVCVSFFFCCLDELSFDDEAIVFKFHFLSSLLLSSLVVLTIDNDVLFHDGWLDECIDILKANKHFGAIGVSFEDIIYPLIKANGYEFEYKAKGNLGTACMVFHKSLHKMLGFFSMDYSQFYGLEDSSWGNRIIFAGLKLGYLKTHGQHLGVGENDVGEYREFKTKEHDSHLQQYYKDYGLYASGQKSLYIPFKDTE